MEKLEPSPCALLGSMENGTTTVENNRGGPQKIQNKITIRSSNPTSGFIFKTTENKISKRELHTNIYSSIIHNNQDKEVGLPWRSNEWHRTPYFHCRGHRFDPWSRK